MARITVPVRMRWSDIDGYGHVNNAALFTLLEEARIATFWDAAAPADRSTGRAGDADSGSRTSHGRAEAARSCAAGPRPVAAEQPTAASRQAAPAGAQQHR